MSAIHDFGNTEKKNYVHQAVKSRLKNETSPRNSKMVQEMSENLISIENNVDVVGYKDLYQLVSNLPDDMLEKIGYQFYEIQLKNIKKMKKSDRVKSKEAQTISDAFDKYVIASVFERSIDGVVLAYTDYYKNLGKDMGEVHINDTVVPNPAYKGWEYMLDMFIECGNKVADIEADGLLHQGREDQDSCRDINVRNYYFPRECEIFRFRQKGNVMIQTSECHSVSWVLTKENKREIVRCLNKFYGIADGNEDDILRYMDENIQFNGNFFLYGREFVRLAKRNTYEIVGLIKNKKINLPIA